jgi:hypothetical protein
MKGETREVVVVMDAAPLAAQLIRRRQLSVLPSFSGARLTLAYGARQRADVARLLAEAGEPEGGAALMARLEKEGRLVTPGPKAEVFTDAARDDGLRLAVAAQAAFYVTSDDELADQGEWKGIRIVRELREVERDFLAAEETTLAWRAASAEEAYAVAEALERAGLEAMVRDGQVPWFDGVMVIGQGYWGDVIVFKKDLPRAKAVLERFRAEGG